MALPKGIVPADATGGMVSPMVTFGPHPRSSRKADAAASDGGCFLRFHRIERDPVPRGFEPPSARFTFVFVPASAFVFVTA
ncbi:hypothetical protein ZOD2009_16713 [Haladaptatus paucihalophilus DX253]|uniref:Uncharacterized protein n=1 Tax=Haladaptatus paucihalophilus DX253 TaxID=797209 RepID=E7QX04_HALPU|nr:hypothetical protein [Haladaptatus paucihalophilus]EFW90807.1 hypothetical protein ZOD2009_16713 [Haladaptatus paucihalophilus DX253]